MYNAAGTTHFPAWFVYHVLVTTQSQPHIPRIPRFLNLPCGGAIAADVLAGVSSGPLSDGTFVAELIVRSANRQTGCLQLFFRVVRTNDPAAFVAEAVALMRDPWEPAVTQPSLTADVVALANEHADLRGAAIGFINRVDCILLREQQHDVWDARARLARMVGL